MVDLEPAPFKTLTMLSSHNNTILQDLVYAMKASYSRIYTSLHVLRYLNMKHSVGMIMQETDTRYRPDEVYTDMSFQIVSLCIDVCNRAKTRCNLS